MEVLLLKILYSYPVVVFFKILFIYSWETQRERQRHRQREKQAPHRDPDVGLDPRTPGEAKLVRGHPSGCWVTGEAGRSLERRGILISLGSLIYRQAWNVPSPMWWSQVWERFGFTSCFFSSSFTSPSGSPALQKKQEDNDIYTAFPFPFPSEESKVLLPRRAPVAGTSLQMVSTVTLWMLLPKRLWCGSSKGHLSLS